MQVSNRKCCWHLHSKTVDKSNCAIGYCCSNILSMVRWKLFNINLVQGFDRFQNYFFSGTLKEKNINLAYLLVGTSELWEDIFWHLTADENMAHHFRFLTYVPLGVRVPKVGNHWSSSSSAGLANVRPVGHVRLAKHLNVVRELRLKFYK